MIDFSTGGGKNQSLICKNILFIRKNLIEIGSLKIIYIYIFFASLTNDNIILSLGSNKRLFSFIQDKIIDLRIDFKKPTIDSKEAITRKTEVKIDLLQSCMKFIIVMVENNHDKEAMIHILRYIDTEKMIKLLYRIYKERIYYI